MGPVPAPPGKSNAGIRLLRDIFDGAMPADGAVKWYEEHLADDFKATFAGGKVVLDKQAYLGVTADILKSFPDFLYTRVSSYEYGQPKPIVVPYS